MRSTVGMLDRVVVRQCMRALTTPFPPLVVHMNGCIADGIQRLYAARERGDKNIRLYIPDCLKTQINSRTETTYDSLTCDEANGRI